MKWLYPYDRTVFPGGLLAAGAAVDASGRGQPTRRVRAPHSKLFDYKGCFGPRAPSS